MCGICGVVYHDPGIPVSSEDVRRMCSTIIHRGPDDEGVFTDRNAGIGMRRLNVIDLATGHQPMANENGRVWVVFNGEIYNFMELRSELIRKGHRFSTRSDTETIIHAYEEYGTDCVKRFNGMFAFAIWDMDRRRLFLARDRLGVKPLYFYTNSRCFVFGSELKAVLENREVPREIDYEALDCFLTLEYIPAPLSIFRGIRKLPPAHTLVWENGKATIEPYWDLKHETLPGSEEELGEGLYGILKDSVRLRLISDVPLGAFLSGGIDSSAVVSIMSELMDRPVKTFSIGFDDPSYNELKYASLVAKRFNTDHHELTIKPDIAAWVERLVKFLDEPLADVSIFPTYLVSQLARKHVTVVLSGDGGDEILAGYDWYVADRLDRYYRLLPGWMRNRWIPAALNRIPPTSRKKGTVNRLKKFAAGASLPADLQHFRWTLFATPEDKSRLYTENLKARLGDADPMSRLRLLLEKGDSRDPLWSQQYGDIHTFMTDDILAKVDRMSMANSLEARTPFLDYRVVEFAMSLPPRMKMKGLTTKYLLKKRMAGILPPEVLHRPKEGFSIPMKNWLRRELAPMMRDVLSESRIRKEGLFNAPHIEKLKEEHLNGTVNHAHILWSLMMFEIWRESYLG